MEFTDMYKKLSVGKIELETIAEQLVNTGAVDTIRKANATAFYAMKWASGHNCSSGIL